MTFTRCGLIGTILQLAIALRENRKKSDNTIVELFAFETAQDYYYNCYRLLFIIAINELL